MILLLGAAGFIGQAFTKELRRRGCGFIPLTRGTLDYTRLDLLFDYIRETRPAFVINAAGYPGKPNVDACELAREQTLCANTLLPQTISRVCLMRNIPWGHVSSGSIYQGAKLVEAGELLVERDLSRKQVRDLFAAHPEQVHGFTELDEPNFSFLYPPCNFYSGSKALAEAAITGVGRCYIWRPGIPFNEQDHSRNFLSKIQRYPKVYDSLTSASHLEDFVRACLDLWESHAPFGIYNVANPGAVTTRQIVELLERILKPNRRFEFWQDDQEFYRFAATAPRSHCILDVSKLLAAGVKMRTVTEALEDALFRWRSNTPALQFFEPVHSSSSGSIIPLASGTRWPKR
ncbi:MAG TPA: sugar nucleotide-binding protein [Pyrinomonadaceae bacterium]|nr:sugar nucleotide-binding protein [Pyrinomonadaceae bacterium]